jgi:predicted HNH restriction endonuclease
MYTVFKALKKNYSKAFLENIQKNMNKIKNDINCTVRKTDDGLACDVSASTLWIEQTDEIINFIKIFMDIIKSLQFNGYETFIDIAVDKTEIEKVEYGLFLHFNYNLIKIFEENNIEFEISIYKGT